jgi:hypothetical protein
MMKKIISKKNRLQVLDNLQNNLDYPTCTKTCFKLDTPCPNKDCGMWIDREEDYNCTHGAVLNHGKLTLREIAERMGVSFVRICQIEKKATQKLYKILSAQIN